MLSQKKQLYLAIIVIIIIGIFFFPNVYKDTKVEHQFCCTSIIGKITNIREDNENYKIVQLADGKEYFLGKYLDKDATITLGDSIVKPQGTLSITVYSNQKIIVGNKEEDKHSCDCD